ncbi:MAG TPA: hypothetical protein VFU53_09695 [Burkholderiales bacterium]|nr:hypothetical protein [Burkholderiales bacterium]
MRAVLFMLLAALALAGCQHEPDSTQYLVPGATDVTPSRTIADGPGKREKPRILVIRAPTEVQLKQIEIARYRGNPEQRDPLCAGEGGCDNKSI